MVFVNIDANPTHDGCRLRLNMIVFFYYIEQKNIYTRH